MQWRPGNGFLYLIAMLYIPALCTRFEVHRYVLPIVCGELLEYCFMLTVM